MAETKMEETMVEFYRKYKKFMVVFYSVTIPVILLLFFHLFLSHLVFQESRRSLWVLPEIVIFVVLVLISIGLIFVRATPVIESSAKALLRSGELYKIFFVKKGYRLIKEGEQIFKIDRITGEVLLDSDGNPLYRDAYDLIKDPDYKYWPPWLSFLGGLRFYIWPIQKILTRTWKWIKSDPEGQLIPRGPETIDYIFVGQDYTYGLIFVGNDIVDKNGKAVELRLAITARIINPKKAWFDVTHWFDVFMARMRAPVRSFINNRTYEEMLLASEEEGEEGKTLDEQILEELGTTEEERRQNKEDIIDVLSDRYGIEVIAIQCSRFSLTGEDQAALVKKWRAQREAEQRSESTFGAINAMIAKAIGKSIKDVEEDFDRDPGAFFTRYRPIVEMAKDFIEQQIASDAKGSSALRRYYFTGAKGGLDIVALLSDTLRGDQGGPRTPNIQNTSNRDADIDAEIERRAREYKQRQKDNA